MQNCILCKKENTQFLPQLTDDSGKNLPKIYDGYCISCRGLFDYLTRVKKFDENEVKEMIYQTFGNQERKKNGQYSIGVFTQKVITL